MIDAISSLVSRTDGVGAAAKTGASALSGGAAGIGDGMSFGQVMADVASNAVSTLRGAEATSISGIQGKASVQQVVEAVMSAEQTLQTALAIRDKVVAAYQELSRMAI